MNNLVLNSNSEIQNKIEGIIAFYNIDRALFYKKLQERIMFSSVKEIEHKENYLLAIVRAMVKEEHLENTAKSDYQYSILDLYRTLREEGFIINSDDMLFIENKLMYIKENHLLTAQDTRNWITKAISYLRENDLKNTAEFVKLFNRSRTMKEIL